MQVKKLNSKYSLAVDNYIKSIFLFKDEKSLFHSAYNLRKCLKYYAKNWFSLPEHTPKITFIFIGHHTKFN